MSIGVGTALAQQPNSNLNASPIKQTKETQERAAKDGVETAKEGDRGKESDRGKDRVSLSPEALHKQAFEANGADKKNSGSPVDQIIARLKEQIEHIKKQLEALAGNDSPEVEKQRKMLTEQLGMLNAALLSAIDKKTKADQEALSSLGA